MVEVQVTRAGEKIELTPQEEARAVELANESLRKTSIRGGSGNIVFYGEPENIRRRGTFLVQQVRRDRIIALRNIQAAKQRKAEREQLKVTPKPQETLTPAKAQTIQPAEPVSLSDRLRGRVQSVKEKLLEKRILVQGPGGISPNIGGALRSVVPATVSLFRPVGRFVEKTPTVPGFIARKFKGKEIKIDPQTGVDVFALPVFGGGVVSRGATRIKTISEPLGTTLRGFGESFTSLARKTPIFRQRPTIPVSRTQTAVFPTETGAEVVASRTSVLQPARFQQVASPLDVLFGKSFREQISKRRVTTTETFGARGSGSDYLAFISRQRTSARPTTTRFFQGVTGSQRFNLGDTLTGVESRALFKGIGQRTGGIVAAGENVIFSRFGTRVREVFRTTTVGPRTPTPGKTTSTFAGVGAIKPVGETPGFFQTVTGISDISTGSLRGGAIARDEGVLSVFRRPDTGGFNIVGSGGGLAQRFSTNLPGTFITTSVKTPPIVSQIKTPPTAPKRPGPLTNLLETSKSIVPTIRTKTEEISQRAVPELAAQQKDITTGLGTLFKRPAAKQKPRQETGIMIPENVGVVSIVKISAKPRQDVFTGTKGGQDTLQVPRSAQQPRQETIVVTTPKIRTTPAPEFRTPTTPQGLGKLGKPGRPTTKIPVPFRLSRRPKRRRLELGKGIFGKTKIGRSPSLLAIGRGIKSPLRAGGEFTSLVTRPILTGGKRGKKKKKKKKGKK